MGPVGRNGMETLNGAGLGPPGGAGRKGIRKPVGVEHTIQKRCISKKGDPVGKPRNGKNYSGVYGRKQQCSNELQGADDGDGGAARRERILKTFNPFMEEVFEATYVEDFINSVDNLDDLARHNSRLFEVHCDQSVMEQKIYAEMSKLLDDIPDGQLDYDSLSAEKRDVVTNVGALLVHLSKINDKGVRATDEVQNIIADRMHILTIDSNNLAGERAKKNPDSSKADNRARNVKKLSINPGSRSRGTPSKTNFPSTTFTASDPKVPFPIALSTASCTSPAPSCASSSSYDNKSGNGTQPTLDPAFLEDSRYRTCKFKNPPTYVFTSRLPSSNCSTPKNSEAESQKKKVDRKMSNDDALKKSRKPSCSSQGSVRQDTDTADSWPSSSPSDSESENDMSPEPTYCLCEKISHGKMVQCDNELCPIEWFHFKCVSLKKIPKGNWYCPRCRGENSSVMKDKSIFFKELEEYNKEKEQES